LDRQEKEAVVEQLGEEIREAESIFAIDYRGISVSQSAELRGKLREADASFRVVKNRLTKLAAEKAGVGELEPMLEGPTALTFVRGDTAAAAKAITTFNREYEVLTYKGGLMGGTLLDEDRFKAIAKLPSRDALNAQLAGIVASPIVGLTRGLGSMVQGLAIQLSQIAEQGLVGGSAEAEAEPSEASDNGAEEAPEESGEETAEEDGGDGGEESADEPTAEAEEESSDESTDEASEEQAGEDAAADDGAGDEAADDGDAGDGDEAADDGDAGDGEGAAEEGTAADRDDGEGEEPAEGAGEES